MVGFSSPWRAALWHRKPLGRVGLLERGRSSGSPPLAVSGMHGVVIQDVLDSALDRDRLASTKRRGKTATGRPAHQVRYSAEAQQRRQLKLTKPMLSSLRASASVVVA